MKFPYSFEKNHGVVELKKQTEEVINLHHFFLIKFVIYLDVDECATSQTNSRGICGSHGTCLNTDGAFTCHCKPGFENPPDNPTICVGELVLPSNYLFKTCVQSKRYATTFSIAKSQFFLGKTTIFFRHQRMRLRGYTWFMRKRSMREYKRELYLQMRWWLQKYRHSTALYWYLTALLNAWLLLDCQLDLGCCRWSRK